MGQIFGKSIKVFKNIFMAQGFSLYMPLTFCTTKTPVIDMSLRRCLPQAKTALVFLVKYIHYAKVDSVRTLTAKFQFFLMEQRVKVKTKRGLLTLVIDSEKSSR